MRHTVNEREKVPTVSVTCRSFISHFFFVISICEPFDGLPLVWTQGVSMCSFSSNKTLLHQASLIGKTSSIYPLRSQRLKTCTTFSNTALAPTYFLLLRVCQQRSDSCRFQTSSVPAAALWKRRQIPCIAHWLLKRERGRLPSNRSIVSRGLWNAAVISFCHVVCTVELPFIMSVTRGLHAADRSPLRHTRLTQQQCLNSS